MLTSYTEQIYAIQHARAYFKHHPMIDIDAALNDAANTIYALKLKEHVEKDNAVEVAMMISEDVFTTIEKLYS